MKSTLKLSKPLKSPPFTDADLRRLADDIVEGHEIRLTDDQWDALLARLEAAEQALMASCECEPKDHPDKCAETMAWNKWCEVASK